MAIAGVATLAIALCSCGVGDKSSESESVVQRFTDLLDEQDYTKAADLTSYPAAASATMKQMFEGLATGTVDYEKTQVIDLDPQSAIFSMDVAWNFGERKDWTYTLQGTVRKLAIGWRITWEPAVVMPQLTNNRTVKLVRTTAKPPPRVVDLAGEPLMTEQTINVIKIDPSRTGDLVGSTNALAEAIEPVAPLITGPSLMQQLAASQGQPVVAVNLREGDFAILEPRMAKVPGVVMEKQPKLISADRRTWSPMLDALREVWFDSQEATAGWGVQIFEADGRFVNQVAGYQGPAGPDISATMDQRLQRAAEDAVVSVGTPASVVAIQPSTGAVVAVAQNSYATEKGPIAFTGLYPAGGTMELFRTVAAATKNKAPQDVSEQEAAEAATALGVGVDFKVHGLDEVTGRIAAPGRSTEQVRQGAGSDAVLASPFGMAIAAAAITRGSVVPPMIENGKPSTTETPVPALPQPAVDRLRAMMHEGIGKPEAAALRGFRDVTAFTATGGSDGWLLAAMGDLVFAVHIADADSGDATSRLASVLLKSLATPEP
ncbi:NTF2-like N-terminal transpeptidase domain-containing protein [Nocardia neocaledoniensis]|uniref:NTF2-like N-terminal transpeptidase domain-containing protein n=1 Tax=Nocardia neocaledoniensis TaxID=236511 RepID=UPI002457C68A|nr:NTF2-like N-terminal transpeptidase domain-containing protein [Nocardia neocaledoniensis]